MLSFNQARARLRDEQREGALARLSGQRLQTCLQMFLSITSTNKLLSAALSVLMELVVLSWELCAVEASPRVLPFGLSLPAAVALTKGSGWAQALTFHEQLVGCPL